MNAPVASGLVVVDKPTGMTSHDVVARVRRLAGTRKVGHAGTLDPMATGVLVLGVNRATRLLGHLTLADKRYDATIRLGAATTTDDAEGEPLSSADTGHLDERAVCEALGAFVGPIEQRPSAVSAVKVDGRRAYQRVRAGEQVELPSRPVTVHELTLRGVHRDGDRLDAEVSVHCSSGTYVRALARDLGERLGVGGHLTALRRTAVGGIGLDEAHPLDVLQEAGSVPLLTMETAARRFFRTATVDAEQVAAVGHGRPVDLQPDAGPGPVAVLDPDGRFLALYVPDPTGAGPARPVAVFV